MRTIFGVVDTKDKSSTSLPATERFHRLRGREDGSEDQEGFALPICAHVWTFYCPGKH